jgi:hypothetical protein
MKLLALYHPNSEHGRMVEEYAHDFEKTRGVVINLASLETREGAATASLYGVVQYPALLVIKEDDHLLVKHWEGVPWPTMDEVAGYR